MLKNNMKLYFDILKNFNIRNFTISVISFFLLFSFLYYFFNDQLNGEYLIENEINFEDTSSYNIHDILINKASGSLYIDPFYNLTKQTLLETYSNQDNNNELKKLFYKNNKQYASDSLSFNFSDLGYALRTFLRCDNRKVCEAYNSFLIEEHKKLYKNSLSNLVIAMNNLAIDDKRLQLEATDNLLKIEINKKDEYFKYLKTFDLELSIKQFKDYIDKGKIKTVYFHNYRFLGNTSDGKKYYLEEPQFDIPNEWSETFAEIKINPQVEEFYDVDIDEFQFEEVARLNKVIYSMETSIKLLKYYKDELLLSIKENDFFDVRNIYQNFSSSNLRLLSIFLISFLFSLIIYGTLMYRNKEES